MMTDVKAGYELTDLGNAKRFVAQAKEEMRWCPEEKEWYSWSGGRWRKDSGEVAAYRIAQSVVESIPDEAEGTDQDMWARIMRHASRSQSAKGLANMIALARRQPEIVIDASKMDVASRYLGMADGAIDLKKWPCEVVSVQDPYISMSLGVSYDLDAQCPIWDQFVLDICDGEAALARYLQRAVGYTLSGECSEQCLFFLYGSGRNGKSTFLLTLMELLGEYATKIPTEVLMSAGAKRAMQEMARLRGSRMVVASESDLGMRFSENTLKDVTGGDEITARHLYGKTFCYRPNFVLWMYGNHQPSVRGTDDGIWRRIRLIPFIRQFDTPDTSMLSRLRSEMPGILMWALRGLEMWRNEGLGSVEAIDHAVSSYREDMDGIGMYLAECCLVRDGISQSSLDLYASYRDWAITAGEPSISRRQFGLRLRERGFRKRKEGGVIIWHGVSLLNPSSQTLHPAAVDHRGSYGPISTFLCKESKNKKSYQDYNQWSNGPGEVRKLVRCCACRNYVRSTVEKFGECSVKKMTYGSMELHECDLFDAAPLKNTDKS